MKILAFAFAQNFEITSSVGCLVGVWVPCQMEKRVKAAVAPCFATQLPGVQSYVSEKGFEQILSDNAKFEEF